MAGETIEKKKDQAVPPAHPNIDKLYEYVMREKDVNLLQSFILLMEISFNGREHGH